MRERDLFLAALDIENLDARQAHLKAECGEDLELLARVQSLLASHDSQGRFLNTPVAEQIADQADAESAATLRVGSGSTDEGDGNIGDEEGGLPATKTSNSNGFGNMTKHTDDGSDDEIPLGYLQPSSKPDSLGRLGHYEVLEVVGRGAFGTVLRAFDEKLQRVVAIKVLSPEMAATSPARKRFLREARTSAAVRHENVVAIYAVEDEPIPYLVMEYIPGQTLQQRLENHGPLSMLDVLKLGKQIADGLAAAHAQDLIHRDIKPGNILLEEGISERVKITDFGLARTTDDASMTQSGMIAGTPLYMAPEQARGETLDHRTDLFSLGSVLYQMVSGRPPFRAANTVAVLKRVCEDTPRAIQEIIPETPAWLSAIILRLLEKDRDHRFQTAQEVATVLGRCQSEWEATGNVVSVTCDAPTVLFAKNNTAGFAGQPDNVSRQRGVMLGMALTLFAVAFVLIASPRIARWFDTPIPSLSVTDATTGLRFDGKDDFVRVEGLTWDYPQFTIECYVTSDVGSDNGTIAVLSGGAGSDSEWMLLFDGSPADPEKRISGAGIKGATDYQSAYGPFRGGERQHRALVYDGKCVNYYINGIWQGKRSAQPHEGMQWKMRALHLGSGSDGRRFFQGTIDQLRASRVARYSDHFEPEPQLQNDKLTLALYLFNEGQGDVLKDSSGHGHDGKIVGAKWLRANGKAKVHAEPSPAPREQPENSPRLAIAPFDAAQAQAHQEAWAKHLGVPVEYTNSIGMKFRLIPPGEFMMGTSLEEAEDYITKIPEWAKQSVLSETPQRKVRIAEPFYLGRTEVTVGQFKQFVAATNYKTHAETNGRGGTVWTGERHEVKPEFTWQHPDLTRSDTHPVGQLCHADAMAFCRWLADLETQNYRLPNEDKWEHACRAGTTTPWSCGNDLETQKLHDLIGWDLTFTGREVGQKPANPFGLFDMHGNLEELCLSNQDRWVARGGATGNDSLLARSAYRSVINREDTFALRSFRVALVDVKTVAAEK